MLSRRRVVETLFVRLEKQFLVCCFGCCVCLLILSSFRDLHTWTISSSLLQGGRYFIEWPTEKKTKVCKLAPLNPWDKAVMPHLKPQENPYKDCIKMLTMLTKLENGTLSLAYKSTEVASNCQYRCLYAKGEMEYGAENWRTLNGSVRISCDFVETKCFKKNMIIFRYIHTQVIKDRMQIYQKEDKLHPSIFLFVLDSTSSSSFARTLMRTNQVLRQYYDATTFYYHNKVGLNSRPNAFGMLTGERITESDEYEFAGRSSSVWETSCKFGPQRNVTVTYDFMEQKYVLFIAEDWPTAFSYPNCNGYGRNIAKHYAMPMIYRAEGSDIAEFFYNKSCKDKWHRIIEYASQFFTAYREVAKFAEIWISRLTHNNVNGLYYTDTVMAEFFLSNVDNFKNSFIFFTGDHGIRHSGIRYTEPGAAEDNNPPLTIILPEYLRDNKQLLLNIRQNARRHTSHYDVYATLYDIAKLAKKYNFDAWYDHDFRKEFDEKRGSRAKSLLRPILYDRTCDEMDIPPDYCLCTEKWERININSSEALNAGVRIFETINEILERMNLSTLCAKLIFTQVLKAEKLKDEPFFRFQFKASPSNGIYEARMVMNNNGTFRLASRVKRIDTFDKQGDCTNSNIARYLCYCKKPATLGILSSTTRINQRHLRERPSRNQIQYLQRPFSEKGGLGTA